MAVNRWLFLARWCNFWLSRFLIRSSQASDSLMFSAIAGEKSRGAAFCPSAKSRLAREAKLVEILAKPKSLRDALMGSGSVPSIITAWATAWGMAASSFWIFGKSRS